MENNKDANALLKQLDIVEATNMANMVSHASKETTLTIIQNCFCKVGIKHHHVDHVDPEKPPVAPALDVWNKVYRWMSDVQFDDFVAGNSTCQTD